MLCIKTNMMLLCHSDYESMDHALHVCLLCEEHVQPIRGIIMWRHFERMVEWTKNVVREKNNLVPIWSH